MTRFVLWTVLTIPAVLWWKESIPFLVTISMMANVEGALSSWQASRAEEKAGL